MSQKEYAEDTTFKSLKSATQFAARRRTVDLFLANPVGGSKPHYNWIDNTELVWTELKAILEKNDPKSIVVNVDPNVAFSSGLHVGEMTQLKSKLGKWAERFVESTMVGVEVVGTMIGEGKVDWYKKLMSTAWTCISEGFSESVIEPGVTSTEVCFSTLSLCSNEN